MTKVFIVCLDYGCDALGKPEGAFFTKEQADKFILEKKKWSIGVCMK